VLAARRRALPSGVVLSWNSLLVQSVLPVEVSPLSVRCSRFVVGPCLGFTVFLRRGPLIVFSAISFILSSSFAFLQSLVQSTLADWPQPVSSSLGLWFPSARAGIGGPLVVSLPHSLRSAFRVWLPSWRFAPFDPWPVLFRTGSALGIHPSESFHRFVRMFPPEQAHLPFLLPLFPTLCSGRPGRPRFLGGCADGSSFQRARV
jgi:hypothetical protein